LQKKLAALPDEMTPQRDLWAGIERAIAVREQDKLSTELLVKKFLSPRHGPHR
jgi:hypothetical protein